MSFVGDGVVPVALAFAVLDLTGSATDLGVVLAARTVSVVGSLLIGGVVADRVGRRRVMVAADLTRFAAQGAVGALLVTGQATVAEIAASQIVLGAATGFFNPASSGLIPVVAGDQLQQANALLGIAMAVGNIIGPAIAGVLVVIASPGIALTIDAVSYAISALLLTRVGGLRRQEIRGSHSFLAELRDGFDVVRSRTWVWSTIMAAAVANTVAVAVPVLGAVVARQQLGGAGAWAIIVAARAVGSLLAGSALLRTSPRRPMLVAALACATAAIPGFVLAVPTSLGLIVVGALVAGVGSMLFNALWETTLQRHIPPGARSRVSAYDWFGSIALQPLGYALVGPLATAVGVSAALYLTAAVQLAAVVLLLTVREIRTLTSFPSGVAAGSALSMN